MINSFRGIFRFLSNFELSRVYLDGQEYPTVENAYQAAKTLDLREKAKFLACKPSLARLMGQHLSLRPDWEEVKVKVMEDLLWQKFAPGTQLRTQLDATKGHKLIEKNQWHDNFWGDCDCDKLPRCRKKGKNMLGKLLMKIRDNDDVKE